MLARIGSRALRRARVPQVKTIVAVESHARVFSSKKSWVPVSDEKLQQVTMKSLIHEVAEQQRELAAKVVPWFLRNMPAAYFRQVPENLRSQHVKAITALRDLMQSDLSLKIQTKLEDDSLQITYINSTAKAGLLHDQINHLVVPNGYELARVNVFSSLDNELALNIFFFSKISQKAEFATRKHAAEYLNFIEEIKEGKHAHDPTIPQYSEIFSPEATDDFLGRVSPSYIENAKPRAVTLHRTLFEKVRGSDGTIVSINPADIDSNSSWITIAAANVLPEVLLRLCSSIIYARGLDISRAHLDKVASPESSIPEIPGYVMMLRLLVNPVKASTPSLNQDKEFAHTLQKDLARSKWLDNETTELGLYRHPWIGLEKAEVITALCSMLHGPLFKKDPNTFTSIKSIIEFVAGNKKYIEIADAIAALFLDRFNPNHPLPAADFTSRSEEIYNRILGIQVDSARLLLSKLLDSVHGTYRTNFYNENRYALSLRLDPNIMLAAAPTNDRPLPFGVFFVHGRNFNAFHNRFRDIARGGLRLVTPANSDQYAIESTRQYDEVYGLSYAQQLKNKDIPEGGSKGVILVNTPGMNESTRFFAMRKSVKAFADSLLDLIVKDSVKNLVDFYGKDELIYLGPDEQIIPSDIEWIIQRAGERGYPIPAAFMSSKKDDGFNHKEFGVTSEGVVVYIDVALKKALNIDPKHQPFTVKITGGPDGDVAGNLMKILYREYGHNCKVVAVADGFGVAEDPDGLNPDEILRLVDASQSIDHFNSSKLGPHGIVLSASTEEGSIRRNTMHFRVKADIFVPGGGRPNTINGNNWRSFLDENGKPSSPLIVEGANLFLTPDARQYLFEKAGVTIVKDSSANKCGVVTSSCEVVSSMLLSKPEFMAIKPELVNDMLERLRLLARLEGELLFREYYNYPGALPYFSERISMAIATVTDAITDALANVQPEDPLFKELVPIIAENLPKKLADVAGDRITTKLPVQYQRNAIASGLASKLVYQEGIHLVETQPLEKLAQRAFAYYRMERSIKKIVHDLETSRVDGPANDHKNTIIDILKRGGTRASLNFF